MKQIITTLPPRIAIVAGGALSYAMKKLIRKFDYIIGVDRGAYWLLQNHIVPNLAVGDFDSVSKRELATIEKEIGILKKHSKEKDATDLELAIDEAISMNPKTIELFGVIGTRMDHTWAGIQLLQNIKSHNILGCIVDTFNEISLLSGFVNLHKSQTYTYVSFFPLDNRATITLTGFRYNVSRRVIVSGSSLGVSNEIIKSPAKVVVHDGTLLMIRSRD